MNRAPPSLSKAVGMSDVQLEKDRVLGQLHWAISSLEDRGGLDTPDPSEAAHDIYSAFLAARVAIIHKRKKGYASSVSVAKQLRQIEAGVGTLLGRLAKADKNVFEALMDAAEDPRAAKDEWLQLRRLLLNMQDQAKRATHMAEVVVKAFSQAKGKQGRPVDPVAEAVTIEAAIAYESRTGKRANRSINRDTGAPEGEFHNFLIEVFQAVGVTASANASNLRLQETLKAGK